MEFEYDHNRKLERIEMKNVPNRNEGFYWLSLFRLHNFITYSTVGNADFTELVGLISTNGSLFSCRFERKSHLFYRCLVLIMSALISRFNYDT